MLGGSVVVSSLFIYRRSFSFIHCHIAGNFPTVYRQLVVILCRHSHDLVLLVLCGDERNRNHPFLEQFMRGTKPLSLDGRQDSQPARDGPHLLIPYPMEPGADGLAVRPSFGRDKKGEHFLSRDYGRNFACHAVRFPFTKRYTGWIHAAPSPIALAAR